MFFSRRFLPLFCTQFLGAFNDNLFKNVLLIAIVFQSAHFGVSKPQIWINIASALFILPFLLISAVAGQMSDQMDKAKLMLATKWLEVMLMLLAAFSLWFQSLIASMICLTLMGAQSALFGPSKYAVLPQYLKDNELLLGNAYIEMGTFIAILLGTSTAGFISSFEARFNPAIAGILLIAILGLISAHFLPPAPSTSAKIKLNWNIGSGIVQCFKICKSSRSLQKSIIAISWFWSVGAIYLTQIPFLAQNLLYTDERAVSLLLTAFAVGISIGSLSCEIVNRKHWLSKKQMINLGSIGVALAALLFYFALHATPTPLSQIDALIWATSSSGAAVLFTLATLGAFGGLFVVPLYTILQQDANAHQRAQVIAANNIMNALWIASSAMLATVLLAYGLSITCLLLLTGLSAIVVRIWYQKT